MATVSGTVSEATGGKFANGAVSGAFVHMFNAEVGNMVSLSQERSRIRNLSPNEFRDEMGFSGDDNDVWNAKYDLNGKLSAYQISESRGAVLGAVNKQPSLGTFIKNVLWINPSSSYRYEYDCHSVSSCNVSITK